ncbi:cupin domain-containing protein [Streptomyces sp. NPDC012769]|uniref:cupin domain-containing protein n=1 Tax=Streptomyces sp. NPDC012769 TaxID=3364848 RepID=UPI0036CB8FF4
MRLVNHERHAMDLRTTPVHLGVGSRAKPVEGFTWDSQMLQAYSVADAADGAEGRMVMLFDGDGLGDHWESHPAGDELVVGLSGPVTVTRDVDGVPDRVLLGPGGATISPARVWHVVDMEGPTSILAITATPSTNHRPRTDTRPAAGVGTPSPEEAS